MSLFYSGLLVKDKILLYGCRRHLTVVEISHLTEHLVTVVHAVTKAAVNCSLLPARKVALFSPGIHSPEQRLHLPRQQITSQWRRLCFGIYPSQIQEETPARRYQFGKTEESQFPVYMRHSK